MEVLAAIGLASNILQFVEFGANLFNESHEIYQSIGGTTRSSPTWRTCASSDRQAESLIGAEKKLISVAKKCKETTDALHNDLESLRLSDAHRGKGASFRQVLKNRLGKSRINDLKKNVERSQKDLMQCLVAVTNHKQSSILRHLEELQAAKLNLVHDHHLGLNRVTKLVQDISLQAAKLKDAEDDHTVLLKSLHYQLKSITSTLDRPWALKHAIAESACRYFQLDSA
ncbi:uncharacterized protein PG986_011797 [Apiospora aurea]|uniref:Fungal N-terminal domain-containing protein n=1 Tax=Apiospora aurea TaxID=335848 RepID=A0ABR1PYK2_9PEZI